MANLYKEIEVMFERLFIKLLSVDRRGLKINGKNEKFSFVDIMVLRMIGLSENISIYDLIYTLDLDRGIISTSISKLTKGRYIEKKRSVQDGRVYLLTLTPEGELLFEKLREEERDLTGFLLENSTINEQKAVLKFLSRMNQTMVGKYQIDENKG